jgi:parvulin-like peptidyl-prolyl isomerase
MTSPIDSERWQGKRDRLAPWSRNLHRRASRTRDTCERNRAGEKHAGRIGAPGSSAQRGSSLRGARLVGVVAALAATIGLTACGASTSARHATSARAVTSARVASAHLHEPTNARTIAAQVGPYSITSATLERRLGAELSSEPPSERLAPPNFSACIATLEREAAEADEPVQESARLRVECEARYRQQRQTALEDLISDYWLIGGARELGVDIDNRQVQAALNRSRRDHSGKGQFQRLLAGRTLADIALQTRAQLSSAAIDKVLDARAGTISQAQVGAYYEAHRFQYLVAGERDVEIARTESQALASRVRAEIASGESFAGVVRQPGVGPADYSSGGGLVMGLQPHEYGEPPLNEAIFTATPGVLSGPIATTYGYFVFKVTKILSNRERPLAEVRASIRQHLLDPRRQQALTAFQKEWTATWTGRTDGRPQESVPKCRQFKGSPTGQAEEPSPLG